MNIERRRRAAPVGRSSLVPEAPVLSAIAVEEADAVIEAATVVEAAMVVELATVEVAAVVFEAAPALTVTVWGKIPSKTIAQDKMQIKDIPPGVGT